MDVMYRIFINNQSPCANGLRIINWGCLRRSVFPARLLNVWLNCQNRKCLARTLSLSLSQDEITCSRISETWRKHAIPWFRYIYVSRKRENSSATLFRHVSGTEMPSHVSAIFKLADFRYCSFPSCFCKRICSCLLHLYQNTNARWFFEQQWILTFYQ